MYNPNLNIVGAIQEMQVIANEQSLQLRGHVFGIVKRAITGKEEIVIDQHNVIDSELKIVMRNTMNVNSDFAMDNLQATQVAQSSLSSALDGKDGIMVFDNSGTLRIQDALAFMASTVHPTDEFGSSPYYRQWRGVYQNLTGSTETAGQASIGQNYAHISSNPPFLTSYADSDFADVTLLDNDILTINWKIIVG